MRSHIKFILAIFILLAFAIAGTEEKQKVKWKGKIEYENGIKVIKNPKEPLYGEITFNLEEDLSIGREDDENYMFYRVRDIEIDGQGNIYVLDSGNHRIQKFANDGNYLHTIGRKGQGPAEFEMPSRLRLDDETGNIYVNDGLRKIKIFDKEGNYIDKDIILGENLIDFYLDLDRNIWGKFSWLGYHSLKRVNHKGKVEKKLSKIPFVISKEILRRSKVGNRGYSESLYIIHGYEHELFISKIDDKTFIYGDSKEYELNIFDKEGSVLFKIRKDEPYKKFTAKEKDRIVNRIKKEALSGGYPIRGQSLRFSDRMPFFYSIFTDCRGRIYVQRHPGRRNGTGIRVYDIFSKNGYYLYRATITNLPYIIKNGHLYTYIVNEDTGEEIVKRFKIKNWDQIKEGI